MDYLGDVDVFQHPIIVHTARDDFKCALKEAVHALCPVFLLDVDQGLEFAQVMGVAGAVAHALEGEVGGVIVMDEDAFEVLLGVP